MRIEYIVWDRLHSGFLHPEPGMITYDPTQAKTLSCGSEEILASLLNGQPDTHQYAVLTKPTDNEKHPAYMTLSVGTAEFVKVKEVGSEQETLLIKNGPQHQVLNELELIESQQSIGTHTYWMYHNQKTGTVRLQFEDSIRQAWLSAKDEARRQQCQRGATQQSKMFAFIRALKCSSMTFAERAAIFPSYLPYSEALQGNPFHRASKPSLQIGDTYLMTDDAERQSRIRKAVRAMLNASRTPFQPRKGKLAALEKEDIRLAVSIMQNADFIEVVGIVHKLPHRTFTGASSLSSRASLEYQLAYHATLNGMRQMVVPPIL
jgi:hypothetical protein